MYTDDKDDVFSRDPFIVVMEVPCIGGRCEIILQALAVLFRPYNNTSLRQLFINASIDHVHINAKNR